jgi:ABC-2 type transport system ATP-binding protein
LEKVRAPRRGESLSFAVPEGSAFALIGANGAGKTTTIKIVMNILQATHGTAEVLGVDSCRLSPRELAQIGYVSENQDMPPRLSVEEFVAHLRPFYPTWDTELEKALLRQLRLPLERRIRDLSHGMRLKIAATSSLHRLEQGPGG